MHLKKPSTPSDGLSANAANKSLQAVKASQVVSKETRRAETNFNPDIKLLNVMFNYNGHTFDAHEVLGVAPGSSFDQIREAFNRTVTERPSQKEFMTAAMSAILEEYRRAVGT